MKGSTGSPAQNRCCHWLCPIHPARIYIHTYYIETHTLFFYIKELKKGGGEEKSQNLGPMYRVREQDRVTEQVMRSWMYSRSRDLHGRDSLLIFSDVSFQEEQHEEQKGQTK